MKKHKNYPWPTKPTNPLQMVRWQSSPSPGLEALIFVGLLVAGWIVVCFLLIFVGFVGFLSQDLGGRLILASRQPTASAAQIEGQNQQNQQNQQKSIKNQQKIIPGQQNQQIHYFWSTGTPVCPKASKS